MTEQFKKEDVMTVLEHYGEMLIACTSPVIRDSFIKNHCECKTSSCSDLVCNVGQPKGCPNIDNCPIFEYKDIDMMDKDTIEKARKEVALELYEDYETLLYLEG